MTALRKGAFSYSSRLWKLDGDGVTRLNDIAKSFDVTNGGRVVTIAYRKGMKWSNGEPLTTAGMQFMWDGHRAQLGLQSGRAWWRFVQPIDREPGQVRGTGRTSPFGSPGTTPYYFIIEKPHGGLRGGTWGR